MGHIPIWMRRAARYIRRDQFDGELTEEMRRREESRDVWRFTWFDTAAQDVRYGARMLRRNLWFTVVAVLSLATGIGSAAAVFNVADAVLFRLLAVRAPHELSDFRALLSYGAGEKRIHGVHEDLFFEMQRATDFAELIAFRSIQDVEFADAPGAPVRVLTADAVSGEYFQVLGVASAAGRLLDARDADDTPLPVVLSERLWRTALEGDRSAAAGRMVIVNGRPAMVVGVAREFRGLMAERPADVFIPLTAAATLDPSSSTRVARLVVRRKPGVTPAVAAERLAALYPRSAATNMIRGTELRIRLVDASTGVSDARTALERPLLLGLALAGVLLVLACANTGGLLLVRFAARTGEFGVRIAIGAGRWRLIRQLVAEALLVGALAAGAGLIIAWTAAPLLVSMIPVSGSTGFELRFDWRLVAFTAAVSLGAALIAAAASLARVVRANPASILNTNTRSIVRGRRRLTETLIAAQVACSLVLLAGAGALARTVANLHRVDPGFDAQRAFAITVDAAGRTADPGALAGYFGQLHERIAAAPHVARASMAQVGLMSGAATTGVVETPGFTPRVDDDRWTRLFFVGPGFFEAAGMPLMAGRGITAQDMGGRERVAVVNEQFARFYFGEPASALDRTINRTIRIVGVAADARYDTLRDGFARAMFVPYTQAPRRTAMTFIVRAAGDSAPAMASTTAAIRAFDPLLRARATLLEDQVASTLSRERFLALLAAVLSALAVFLSCAGLYAAVAFAVSERRSELAVRLAIGATRRDIARLVLHNPLRTTLAGIAAGVPIVYVVMRGVSALLFGVTPFHLPLLAAAAAGLISVAVLAALWPAYRAGRIDPIEALRCG